MGRPLGRKPSNPPKYKLHKASGKAVVRLNGKEIYLGVYNSPESLERYQRLIAENWATGKPVEPVNHQSNRAVTVGELVIEYGKFCKVKYAGSNEWATIKIVLEYLIQNYKTLPACDFGTVRLDQYRQTMVKAGLVKSTIKRRVNHVVAAFQRGVSVELIDVTLYQRLKALSPLVEATRQPKKIPPVAVDVVRLTQGELTPVVADMVELQLLTGMRPGEVCDLRPMDIDTSREVWIYTPATHKTQHHGKSRVIAIGYKAQALLEPYIDREQSRFCFEPSEALEQHLERRSANRETPIGYGNSPKPRRQRVFSIKYTNTSYRRAVQRAASRAKVGNWSPNQLRKAAATRARSEMGLETAQIICGHSSKTTTEQHYAEQNIELAVKYAAKFG
ncbi:site-specific integrase [Mariniblastus sp.]|nr:site-specific integrase [Mariniblastus sp.]